MSTLDWPGARRREHRADEAHANDLMWAWRAACEGAGLVQQIDTPMGPSILTPRLVDLVLGPPTVLLVELLPGQIAADIRRAGYRVAGHLGAVMLRVEPHGLRHVRVELLSRDPLAGVLPLQLPRLEPGTLLGLADDGLELVEVFRDLAHVIVQGVTRSGKSVFTYGLLAQLADDQAAIIAGCDPTGLLWRPFTGTRHASWQVSGVGDLHAHEQLLTKLVDEMDRRIGALPLDRDTIEITTDTPMLVVVLEELAGLLRVLDIAKTKTDDPGKRVRALIARLLGEGAKVAIRVVIIMQRAEAAIIGAFERAMCSVRISFRVDNRASVELLHPGTAPELADAHTTALPGIALMSAPGRDLIRFRAPYIGGYTEYSSAVATACRRDHES